MVYSFFSVYWSQQEQKPLTSNIIINNSSEFDKVVYSLSKIKQLNNYDNIYNKSWINNDISIITNSNIIIGSNDNNSLTGNFLIEGNIKSLNSNFNLGSNGYMWKYLYGNSIYIDDISIKTSNKSLYIPSTISISNMDLNSILFKLSNNQLVFESNGVDINTINFDKYQKIIYSNNLYSTSNVLVNELLYKLNNLFTTDTIPLGINNKFITDGIINSNITFTKDLNVIKSYNFKGFNVPFEISNSNIFFKGYIKGSNIIDLNFENEFTINQKLAPIQLKLTTTSNNYISYKNKKNIDWNSNNSNIFINRAVGIGNSNPTTALDVTGDINFTQNLKINNFIFPFSIYSNTNIIASNSTLSLISGTNFGYYSFLTNGSISFPQATNCDILVVGAGGNGGEGAYAGGGGAGEVIYYPSYPFLATNYNIQVGQSSFNSNLRISQLTTSGSSVIKALGGGNGGYSSNNPEIGGSGGGGSGGTNINFYPGSVAGVKWNVAYSYSSNGFNGTLNQGGNGGNSTFTTSITGINQTVGLGGIGATSNSIPLLKTTYGSGGDGNWGLGTPGIVIIKVPLNIQKTKFEGSINYSNVDNKPVLNELITTNNYLTIGTYNQVNFPLGNVSWNNEWFIRVGKTPSLFRNSLIFSHLTSNINATWWLNGTQTSNSEIYQNSDERIKKEISEISNSLDKLMALKPKEYYLCDDKDYIRKYGIIAQEVESNQELNHLVYTDTDYIANIYSKGIYISENKIIHCDNPIINKIEVGDELKILLDNPQAGEIIIEELPYQNRYKKRFVKVMKVIDDYSFKIFDDIELSNDEKNNLFIYGKKIYDFKKLDYASIYTLNIRSTQELLFKIRNNEKKIEELQQRLNRL